MGRVIDHNSRYSPEDRQFLIERGRGYLLHANERRFGTPDAPRDPLPHEQADSHAISPFYNPEVRNAAVYDKGGAPLPGTTLDYDTGRIADRNNGVLVEFTGPGHTPGASTLGPQRDDAFFDSKGEYDDDIDDDIVQSVLQMDDATLTKALTDAGFTVTGEADQEEKENAYAIYLQDVRDGKVQAPATA